HAALHQFYVDNGSALVFKEPGNVLSTARGFISGDGERTMGCQHGQIFPTITRKRLFQQDNGELNGFDLVDKVLGAGQIIAAISVYNQAGGRSGPVDSQ